jgi:carbamate kinase
MRETLVIALGGNAITRPGERGTIPQQFAHTAETLEHLVPLFRSDRRIVITHGNGPQIGNILIRSEEGERRVPPLPLDTCVSDSQGGMGYMIQRVADQIFRREDILTSIILPSPWVLSIRLRNWRRSRRRSLTGA